MRMDRYKDVDISKEEDKDTNYSRVNKNQNVYQDIYMNNSYISIDDLFDEKKDTPDDVEEKKDYIDYEEKNYDINEYLSKARERFQPDDEKRNLDEEFLKGEDEISKLISSIDEKNQEEDFFGNLISDNSDTMIDGQLTKDEILETTSYEEYTFDTTTNSIQLSKVLGDETMVNLALEEEKNNEGFSDIEKNNISSKSKRKLAIIIFVLSLLLLIGVIIFIVLPKL